MIYKTVALILGIIIVIATILVTIVDFIGRYRTNKLNTGIKQLDWESKQKSKMKITDNE